MGRLKAFLAIAAATAVAGCSQQSDPFFEDPKTGRWYSRGLVVEGRQLYRQYCGECHGRQGEGAADWNKPDAQGFYPPPPLDGSAHSWHHPYPMLHRTIAEGSRGRMPAWGDTLSDQQIRAVIAAFQSYWPDRAYELWLQRHR